MYKNATKCNKTLSKWCMNKHGASKIIGTFETYQQVASEINRYSTSRFVHASEEEGLTEVEALHGGEGH
jgi:hypothetical protein